MEGRDEDREIASRAADRQARSQDYRLMDLPGYMAWSEQRLDEGESDALIARLDATSMWLLPEEAADMSDSDYDALLDSLRPGGG